MVRADGEGARRVRSAAASRAGCPRGERTDVLKHRLLVGTFLALLVIGVLIVDAWLSVRLAASVPKPGLIARWAQSGLLCTLVVLAFSTLATRELLRFARATGDCRPFPVVAYVFGAGLVFGPYISFNLHAETAWYDESWGMMWLAIALGLAFILQAAYRRSEHAMVNLAATLLIIFYAGGLAGYLTKLRMELGGERGIALLLFSVFVVKMTDVGAYFVGRAFGRTKLIAWLSPGKTWEGLMGGVLVAVISSVAVGLALGRYGLHHLHIAVPSIPWIQLGALPSLVLFGLLMAAVSVAGDLFASLLKRDAAMKDSGSSLPGMGGVLDVLDSPLLAAPAAWFFWTRLAQIGE